MRLPQAVIGQRSTRSLEINQRGSKRLWEWKYLVLTSVNDQLGLALTPISWMGKLRLSVLENMAKVKGGWRWSQVSVNLNLLVKEPSGVSALPREGRGQSTGRCPEFRPKISVSISSARAQHGSSTRHQHGSRYV